VGRTTYRITAKKASPKVISTRIGIGCSRQRGWYVPLSCWTLFLAHRSLQEYDTKASVARKERLQARKAQQADASGSGAGGASGGADGVE
jgi:hypothetical protein